MGYDFAILIGTKEDTSTIRRKRYHTIRDNVIFEYGLFTGSVGRQRTFILKEAGAKLPSDLDGITWLQFKDQEELKGACAAIARHIEEEVALSRVSMLPSTASAITYYENFLKPVCDAIYQSGELLEEAGNGTIRLSPGALTLKVILPEELHTDLKPYVNHLVLEKGYSPGTIKGAHRPYPLYYQKQQSGMVLMDIPTNLNSSSIAINLFWGKDFLGNTDDLRKYMEKEIANFKTVLSILLPTNAYTKQLVKVAHSQEA